MDWRNHQLRRKELFTMDEKKTEFDLLVQRTIREIAIRERIRRSIQLLQGTPKNTQETLGNTGVNVIIVYLYHLLNL